jgi:hypothetical protein
MKKKKHFAIALVLGLFLLGGIITINTISADPVRRPFDDYETNKRKNITDSYLDLDFENVNFSLYLVGYLLDDDDNSLGYVNITGGFRLEPDGRYYVYGSAFAETASDVDGRALASGKLAGRGEVVDGPNWNEYASAWDAFYTDNFPVGSGKAYAELTVDGATIWISIDGAI